MEKIFELKKDNLKLKININKNSIITSWLHNDRVEYSNRREFDICMIDFAFITLKPVCNTEEYNIIENFMFNKKEGEQLSLF
jgi:hypothetical protein